MQMKIAQLTPPIDFPTSSTPSIMLRPPFVVALWANLRASQRFNRQRFLFYF